MKTATVKQLKQELEGHSPAELVEICLRLSKFKKENKELLTYLLYEIDDESSYVNGVKLEIEQQFTEINISSYYFMKKSVRKILRNTKKHIRYSKKKETEVELLMYFCYELRNLEPSIDDNTVLQNIFNRQVEAVNKAIKTLHEDLRYDYQLELNSILSEHRKSST
jgi:hypothetical protein